MTQQRYILAIDQGTTSSRAIVFDTQANVMAVAQQEFTQHYPKSGWVEHDPEEIWSTTLAVSKQAIAEAEKKGGAVVAIGITNQRETAIVWDRETGKPIYNAIVWQDRRTADVCRELKNQNHEPDIQVRTGLLLDPYFSASKVAWILDNVSGARIAAEAGKLAFGTVDSFLIWRLTGGASHVTDATNASRTCLFNIRDNAWDDKLLQLFRVPQSMLPEVKDCAADFGVAKASLLGKNIPILGVAGDQHAAMVGQACFAVGDTKSTYGTGCFALMNIGEQAAISQHRLLTTVAYRLNGKSTFALEGSIFIAGAAVQWLRDELKMIQCASETEAIAQSIDSTNGVYLVPAFTGLGAPYWQPDVRGALVGLSRGAGRAEVVRAALESVCYQTHDLMTAMAADGSAPTCVRVDGGMTANNWCMQYLSDILDLTIDKPTITEITALGAAFLAGLQAGMYKDVDDIKKVWQLDQRYTPQMDATQRAERLAGWQHAVAQVLA